MNFCAWRNQNPLANSVFRSLATPSRLLIDPNCFGASPASGQLLEGVGGGPAAWCRATSCCAAPTSRLEGPSSAAIKTALSSAFSRRSLGAPQTPPFAAVVEAHCPHGEDSPSRRGLDFSSVAIWEMCGMIFFCPASRGAKRIPGCLLGSLAFREDLHRRRAR